MNIRESVADPGLIKIAVIKCKLLSAVLVKDLIKMFADCILFSKGKKKKKKSESFISQNMVKTHLNAVLFDSILTQQEFRSIFSRHS